jgi:hypothetical protein
MVDIYGMMIVEIRELFIGDGMMVVKQKYNIGDKVKVEVTKEVDGVMMAATLEWYVIAVWIANDLYTYNYTICGRPTEQQFIKHVSEKDISGLVQENNGSWKYSA